MNPRTLKILNELRRNEITEEVACKLLGKTPQGINELFDSKDYVYIPTLKDEKLLAKIEKENIKEMLKNAKKKKEAN